MNRICNIYFHYENYDKSVREKIKEKMDKINIEKTKVIQNNVDSIGDILKHGNNIISNYKRNYLKNDKAYEDIHHLFKKYHWKFLKNKNLYEDPRYNLYTDDSIY